MYSCSQYSSTARVLPREVTAVPCIMKHFFIMMPRGGHAGGGAGQDQEEEEEEGVTRHYLHWRQNVFAILI